MDLPVLFFALAASALAALLAGLMPALRVSAVSVHEVLQDESRGASSLRSGRWSRAVVAVAITLAFPLLVGAGLMVRSVAAADTGDAFSTDGILVAQLRLPGRIYQTGDLFVSQSTDDVQGRYGTHLRRQTGEGCIDGTCELGFGQPCIGLRMAACSEVNRCNVASAAVCICARGPDGGTLLPTTEVTKSVDEDPPQPGLTGRLVLEPGTVESRKCLETGVMHQVLGICRLDNQCSSAAVKIRQKGKHYLLELTPPDFPSRYSNTSEHGG